MSNRKEVLGKLWAHFNFSLTSLVDRIVLQKTIYVLSYLNYPNLGDYKKDFAMYIHGPYSPLLAHDAYDLSENLKIKSGFSETEEEKVSLFEESVKFAAEGNNKLEHFMACELVADIIFLYSNEKVRDENKLFEILKEKKTYFNDSAKVFAVANFLKEKKII